MATLVKVADLKGCAPGTALKVEAAGQHVALFNVGGTFYAIGDTCTHRGGPLSEGTVSGTEVTCPWHGATYDLRTGNVTGRPAVRGVPSFKVVIEGDNIKVEVP